MALLKLVVKCLETAGHGVATGATALADAATGRLIPELREAREDQERRMHAAARGVDEHGRVVGADLSRVVGTTGVSVAVLARIITDLDQLKRLLELVESYDLKAFLEALVHRGGQLPANFFPSWVRRAGGYFPKLAQVLSVRADLIHNREVLEQLSQCLEDMPARRREDVCEHLAKQGWDTSGVGEALNAGTVAQVNAQTMPDGSPAVLKVAWPDTQRQMRTDFRLFAHAREILGALRLEDEQAQAVAAIFVSVGKSEAAVLREFDMLAEATALQMAAELCRPGGEWDVSYVMWLSRAPVALAHAPAHLSSLGLGFAAQALARGARVRTPEVLRGLVSGSTLSMSRAGGESLHKLLNGAHGPGGCREAAEVLLGCAVPFVGWLLLCKSTSHLAHIDPHPGNFRWDAGERTLWVLDWGSHINLTVEQRHALCLLICLASGSEVHAQDDAIADTARAFGIRSDDNAQLSKLVHGILNATANHAAQEALNAATVDHFLSDVDDAVVPVVRCLATLGGLLKELQRKIRDEHHQDVPLSLATVWEPFATMGLAA